MAQFFRTLSPCALPRNSERDFILKKKQNVVITGTNYEIRLFTMFGARSDENILERSRPFSLGQNPKKKKNTAHKVPSFENRVSSGICKYFQMETGKQCWVSISEKKFDVDRKSSILVWPNFQLVAVDTNVAMPSSLYSIQGRITISFRHKSPSSPELNLALCSVTRAQETRNRWEPFSSNWWGRFRRYLTNLARR